MENKKFYLSNHRITLGYECASLKGDFETQKVKDFLTETLSKNCTEFCGTTFLRTLPKVHPLKISIQIVDVLTKKNEWIVVFYLKRPLHNVIRGSVDNTFIYREGDTFITSITDVPGNIESMIEGSEIKVAQ